MKTKFNLEDGAWLIPTGIAEAPINLDTNYNVEFLVNYDEIAQCLIVKCKSVQEKRDD